MLTPERLDKLPEPMVKLMSELENDIISDICRRLQKADLLTPTAEWQLWKANQLTLSSREIKARIARKLKKSEKELREIYTDAVKEAIREDEKIYQIAIAEGILSDDYRDKLTRYTRSAAFSNALKQGLKNTNGVMRNLTNSAAAAAIHQLSDALDLAYLKCINGAFTPQEAIFDAVKKLGADGIKCVNYDSGRTDQLDVAVRRAVVTGIGKTCGDMQLGLAKEMDCRYVEVSSHLGARPSHAEWQGKIYSLVKDDPKYPYFYDATGYGRGDGLCGWNCRHSFFPYFEGISMPANAPTFDSEENKRVYEETQKQRRYERAIRKSKRELAALDAARGETVDPALKAKYDRQFERKSVTLKKQEARLREHLGKTGLLPDNSRVRVDGFGRSVSQKAVQVNKRYIAKRTNIKATDEDGYRYEPVDRKFIKSRIYTKQFKGISKSPLLDARIRRYATSALNINDNTPRETLYAIPTNLFLEVDRFDKKHYRDKNDGVEEWLMKQENDFIIVHNHPNNTSLSIEDLLSLNNVDKMKGIISIGHDGKLCVVSIGKAGKFEGEIEQGFFERAYNRNTNEYGFTNEAIKKLCEEVGWTFGTI